MLHSVGRTLWLPSCSRPIRSLQRRSERCGEGMSCQSCMRMLRTIMVACYHADTALLK